MGIVVRVGLQGGSVETVGVADADCDSAAVRERAWLAFPRLNRHRLGVDPRNLENIQFLLAGPTDSLMRAAGMLKVFLNCAGLSISQRGSRGRDKDMLSNQSLHKSNSLIMQHDAGLHKWKSVRT